MKRLLVMFLVVQLLACSQSDKPVSDVEYLAWMENEENGFFQQKTIENITFSLFRQTSTYRTLKSTDEQLGEQFVLRISPKERNAQNVLEQHATSTEEYFSLLQYFNTAFRTQIELVDLENSTALPIAYMNIPNYRTANYLEFVFAFNQLPLESEFKIVINDNVFDSGPVVFRFKNTTPPYLIANAK